ncbi:MAG: HAMP domain-containing protein [Oscillospiraceae bacterium]|jgi:two-component system OmpR family sensor kinase|nr:HAMP domain-containing protein [Oscillospiraceae bacterium]
MEQENRGKRRKSRPVKPEQAAEERQQAADKRPRGKLRWRWLLNTLGATLVVVAVAVTAFSLAMYSYCTSTILATLESKAQTAAGMFRNYTETTYLYNARQFVNQFEEKNYIEVQILNASGRVQISSMMDISGAGVETSDVSSAIAEKRVVPYTGPDPSTGDHIIAASAPVVYNGTVVGVVRMVTSLRQVEDQMFRIIAFTSGMGLVILIVMGVTASYFIKSVLDPVIRVTETAKRIATGSYGVQMESRSNDEMGDLVDAINDMSMKIDQAERTQSEFISSVSHELRTPLTAISGWAETLYNGEVRDAADVKKGMGIIVSEAQRLTRMVEELLEFSRMETGRFNLSVEPIDILAELEDAVYTYREFFRRKNLELDYTEGGEELPLLSGDPERLRQVFCNLLDNADKHGGSGGRIEVSVGREEDHVVIRIRDHGPGVPEDELPYIKYKFYKGSSKARGSGIGLAVCDEIINSHNGTLEIGNAPGGGCAVTIRLPIGVENV